MSCLRFLFLFFCLLFYNIFYCLKIFQTQRRGRGKNVSTPIHLELSQILTFGVFTSGLKKNEINGTLQIQMNPFFIPLSDLIFFQSLHVEVGVYFCILLYICMFFKINIIYVSKFQMSDILHPCA